MVVRKIPICPIFILQKLHWVNILLDMILEFQSNISSDGDCVHAQDRPNIKNMCTKYSTV